MRIEFERIENGYLVKTYESLGPEHVTYLETYTEAAAFAKSQIDEWVKGFV